MGLDWTALEEAIRRSALRQAKEVIDSHPGHVFYAVALDGVSMEPGGRIELPVLALNSEQAFARDIRQEVPAPVPPGLLDDDEVEEEEEAPLDTRELDVVGKLPDEGEEEGSAEDELDEEYSEDFDEDFDFEDVDLDGVADEAEATGRGFYSSRWNPPEWHWCSMELFDESATEMWSDALTEAARRRGWEETIKRYYDMLISVTNYLAAELAVGRNSELVAYLSDEDHADTILRRCLTPEQLGRHFPELVSA